MYQPARIGTFMNRAKNLRIARLARVISTGIAALLFFFLVAAIGSVLSCGYRFIILLELRGAMNQYPSAFSHNPITSVYMNFFSAAHNIAPAHISWYIPALPFNNLFRPSALRIELLCIHRLLSIVFCHNFSIVAAPR